MDVNILEVFENAVVLSDSNISLSYSATLE